MLETVADDLVPTNQETCPVCGASSFFQEGGFYYCSQCNTQSQVSQLYVDENFFQERGHVVRAAVLRGEKQKKETAQRESRRQLSSWEIWNIALKNMADRLIEIGFSEDVRTKIFHIYVSFMMKRKVIFVSTFNPRAKSKITVGEPKTNLYTLCGIKRLARKKNKGPYKRKLRSKKISQQAMALDEDDTLPLSLKKRRATRNKTKAMEKDYIAKETETPGVDEHEFDKIIGEASREKPVEQEDANKIRNPRRVYTHYARTLLGYKRESGLNAKPGKQIQKRIKKANDSKQILRLMRFERFSLNSCLITVFVALRELGYPVVMADILRLHFCGVLNVENLQDSINQVEDYQDITQPMNNLFYKNRFINYHVQAQDIENFIKYVGLKKFNYPLMKELVPKYIDEFVLPREFECLVNLINHMFTFNDYSDGLSKCLHLENCQTMPEIIVLAQFVIVLKMLFGFDDRTEKFQSKFAQLVNKLIKDEVQKRNWEMEEWTELFVIEEWFSYLQRRRELVKRELCSSYMYTPNKPPSIAKLHDLMKNCSIDDELEENDQDETDMTPQEKAAISCKRIFQNIVKEALAKEHQEISKLQQYVPLPLPTESVVKQYIERYPLVADQSVKPELLMVDFVQKRLDFVWNPKKYTKLLKQHGYRVKVIRGDAINNFPSELSKEIAESKIILLFQPYKKFDEFVGRVRDDCSSSMKLLLGLCEDIIPVQNPEKIQLASSEPHFQKLVNAVGDMYIKRVLSELVPIMTRWDQPDSD